MASRYPKSSSRRRSTPFISERQIQAYLATREALRRIALSSTLADLDSDAVNIQWSGLGPRATSEGKAARR